MWDLFFFLDKYEVLENLLKFKILKVNIFILNDLGSLYLYCFYF